MYCIHLYGKYETSIGWSILWVGYLWVGQSATVQFSPITRLKLCAWPVGTWYQPFLSPHPCPTIRSTTSAQKYAEKSSVSTSNASSTFTGK